MGQAQKQTRSKPDPFAAFINIPYDDQYEPLFLAFIAGLVGFGLRPRGTLEIPSSTRRLDRILQLVHECRYSFHDISRVELDKRHPRTPRFNMPFELGMVVVHEKLVDKNHKWFVWESRPHRQKKSLSDLDGTEIWVHHGTPTGLFRELTNALSRSSNSPTVEELRAIYRDIRQKSENIRRTYGSLFQRRPFIDLVYAAQVSRISRGIPRGDS